MSILAHLSRDTFENESKIEPNGRDWRTVSNGFVYRGNEASTRILTLREHEVEEDITFCRAVAQFTVIFVRWAERTLTTAVFKIIVIMGISNHQIVFILKLKQLHTKQNLTLTDLQSWKYTWIVIFIRLIGTTVTPLAAVQQKIFVAKHLFAISFNDEN